VTERERRGRPGVVSLNDTIPALVIAFQLDAPPHLYGTAEPDEIDRILLGLSPEWRDLLGEALAEDGRWTLDADDS
jgi:hypothetical protein